MPERRPNRGRPSTSCIQRTYSSVGLKPSRLKKSYEVTSNPATIRTSRFSAFVIIVHVPSRILLFESASMLATIISCYCLLKTAIRMAFLSWKSWRFIAHYGQPLLFFFLFDRCPLRPADVDAFWQFCMNCDIFFQGGNFLIAMLTKIFSS